MKNAEQAANEMKNEGGNIFDQLKEMLGDAANDSAGVFDKLKGIFEGKEGDPSIFDKAKDLFDGKEGEPGMLDQLKEILDKGTSWRKPRWCLSPRRASPACWIKLKKCSVRVQPPLAK